MSATDRDTFVVVGGGLAAATAAAELREVGFDGRVVVVGEEPHRPYERPPLSKSFLLGDAGLDSAFVHTEQWYADHDVELLLGAPATRLDPAGHTVTVGGRDLRYDRLLLATGSSPRRLAAVDDADVGAAYLRTMDDAERLKSGLTPGRRVVVVGGGWIGLEVASAARAADCRVTVVEMQDLPLVGVLGSEVAGVFATLHREHGVDLRTGRSVSEVHAAGAGASLRLDDGSTLDADLVVVGVGAQPRTELAERAGIGTDDGVLTDERLTTSDSDVLAAGDVARAYHPVLRRHLRVEHWDNAIAQGRHAARAMLGRDVGYDQLPYFFTDQYDLGMEYVGAVGPDGYGEAVVRGDVEARVFTAFWVEDGHVVAGMHANDWDAIDDVRRVVGADRVDLAALRDSSVPLSQVSAG